MMARDPATAHPRIRTAVAALSVVAVAGGCATVVDGSAVSVYADPFHVAGLPATDGPSGVRPDSPDPTREAVNSDGGRFDRVALLAVSDLEQFWAGAYQKPLDGKFTPVESLVSWDYYEPDGPEFCGGSTFEYDNASFCQSENNIGWDRGEFFPTLWRYFGDMSLVGVMAHEYGHALQYQSWLVGNDTPTIVWEQQADCFEGVFMRWIAEGDSKRFTLSTGDGLNMVLAALVAVRDPIQDEETRQTTVEDEHGSAFERISAFQFGFTEGVAACVAIDEEEIAQRRGNMPLGLQGNENGELPVTEESVTDWVQALNVLFAPAEAPRLTFDPPSSCGDVRAGAPVSYCPETNTISVDLPALQELGAKNDDMNGLVFGDNSAYSVLTSRYMLAIERQQGGLVLDNAQAALRTACLTGVATARFSGGVEVSPDVTLSLSAGDLDEAVSGILTNGLAASDVDGASVPAGFSRVDAFRTGVLGDEQRCFARYP